MKKALFLTSNICILIILILGINTINAFNPFNLASLPSTAIKAEDSQEIISPNEKINANYWIKENEKAKLMLKCANPNQEEITRKWFVEAKFASDAPFFIFDAEEYGIGSYRVIGQCYLNGLTNKTQMYNVEVIGENDFSVIALPDTQYYSEYYPNIFTSQTQWIKNYKDILNIKFVSHEGDIVEVGSSTSNWENANTSMSILDNILPYAITTGNHDYDNLPNRTTTQWDFYLGKEKFQDNLWWGGSYEGDNINTYQFFAHGGIEFLMLHLEFCPRNQVLNWANNLVEENPNKIVIITTHVYLDAFGSRTHVGTEYGCSDYGFYENLEETNPQNGNEGREQWNKLIKQHKNIYLVLCGHISEGTGTAYLKTPGINNNEVHQMLANYQEVEENGGNGYLRILRFSPQTNKVFINTYSPYQNHFKIQNNQKFNIEFYPNEYLPIQKSKKITSTIYKFLKIMFSF